MTDWFQRLSPRDDMHLVMLAMVVALAVTGVAAHWLTRIPGPLTEAERIASRGSRVRRLLGWLALLLAGIAWCAVVLMFTSPQRPTSLVLVSRSRTEPIPAQPEVVLSTARGVKCAKPPSTLFDVGTTVDRAIAALDRTHPWERGSAQERRLARELVAATPDAAREIDALRAATAGTLPRPAPPRWLIESIELSIVLRTVHERHVEAVYVAPGATLGASSWRILGDVLHARGIRLCLIAPPVDPDADELVIRRLAYATLDREARTVTAWAVVDGLTPADERGRTLEVRVRADTPLPVTTTIAQDEERSRIVPLCFGACPNAPSEHVYEHVARANEAFLSSTNGEAATPIVDVQLLRQRPQLHFERATDSVTYRVAFDERTMFPEETAGLVVELQANGVPMPTTRAKKGTTRHAHLREVGTSIVVASSAAAAHKAKLSTTAGGGGAGRRTRIFRDELGPRTLNSFAWTAPPLQTSSSPHLPHEGAVVQAGVGGPSYQPFAGIVRIEHVGNDTIVVIDAGTRPNSWSKNPFWGIPILRTIAYAADIVTRPPREELTTSDDLSATTKSAPLVTEADLADAFRRQRRPWDLACVFAIGVYLLVTWRRRAVAQVRR